MEPAATEATDSTRGQNVAPRTRRWSRWIWPVLLLALLVLLFRGYEQANREARKNSCKNYLRSVGLSLQSYQDWHGSLPPAHLVDSTGTPTHSWRTIISPSIFYDLETDYFAQLDLSKPWDDPVNTAVLDRYVGTIQCPEREERQSKLTPYVAVVGEGTPWPTPMTGDKLPVPLTDEQRAANRNATRAIDHPAKILVVEWPESDIQWTEPRDLSVEEFLKWFETQRGEPTIHPGDSILYLGDDFEAHELPLETSVAEVRALLMADGEDIARPRED
ncbi:DUF1559 domain-containing protein [Aeoliella sp. ICT_H6.2]|uniref:DUF1559 domain-containing protein n=1 Tax=Aeoliella straminimaris TaxID=2954799 RepID=A0A9X2F6N6_9BACT|nr:DUF1559 domain-containing protein [Aeoliella straminimaris]MCO6042648.1 DUF1559 domain-containing protein [Aeoliella straminimaris]